jgi:hypothetical protein
MICTTGENCKSGNRRFLIKLPNPRIHKNPQVFLETTK